MGELLTGVNWIAVIAGVVLSFLAGWLWYSPKLFGEKWADGVGVKMDKASAMPLGAMVSQVLGLLLLSWFIGVMAVSNLLLTALLGALAFIVLGYSGGMFTQKSAYARAVDAGYWIVSVILMILCQALL